MSELVQIGATRYLVGLDWHAFDDRISRRDLVEAAAQGSAPYVAGFWYASGRRYALAFASALPGRRRRLHQHLLLAEQIAVRAPRVPCAYVAELATGGYVVCAVDAARMVLPGGDSVLRDAAAARAALLRYADLGDDGGGAVELSSAELAEFLQQPALRRNDVHRFSTRFRSGRGALLAAIVVLLTLAAAGGAWLWQRKVRGEEALAAALARSRMVVYKPAPTGPEPTSFIASCAGALAPLPSVFEAHAIAEVVCAARSGPTSVEVRAAYRGGQSEDFAPPTDAPAIAPPQGWSLARAGGGIALQRRVDAAADAVPDTGAGAHDPDWARRYCARSGACTVAGDGGAFLRLEGATAPWTWDQLGASVVRAGQHIVRVDGTFGIAPRWQIEIGKPADSDASFSAFDGQAGSAMLADATYGAPSR